MIVKRAFLFFLLISIVSCSQHIVDVENATKRLKHPGLPTGKTYVVYQVEFSILKETTLKEVRLGTGSQKLKFEIYSSNKKSYINKDDSLKIGKYTLSFKTADTKSIDDDLTALLIFKNENQEKRMKVNFIKKDPSYGK